MTMIGGMGLYCFYLLCGGYVVNHDDNNDDDDDDQWLGLAL